MPSYLSVELAKLSLNETNQTVLPYPSRGLALLGTVGTGMIWGPGRESVWWTENTCRRRSNGPTWRICGWRSEPVDSRGRWSRRDSRPSWARCSAEVRNGDRAPLQYNQVNPTDARRAHALTARETPLSFVFERETEKRHGLCSLFRYLTPLYSQCIATEFLVIRKGIIRLNRYFFVIRSNR